MFQRASEKGQSLHGLEQTQDPLQTRHSVRFQPYPCPTPRILLLNLDLKAQSLVAEMPF